MTMKLSVSVYEEAFGVVSLLSDSFNELRKLDKEFGNFE